MDFKVNIDIFESDIKTRIANFERKQADNKRKTMYVVVFGALISATTTVLIGLSKIWIDLDKYLSTFALITSSSLSVLYAWDALFNHRKLWVNYTDALNKLYDIETDLRHLKVSSLEENEQKVNLLYENYKLILKELNEEWKSMRTKIEDHKQ